jgi:hypothetical protein
MTQLQAYVRVASAAALEGAKIISNDLPVSVRFDDAAGRSRMIIDATEDLQLWIDEMGRAILAPASEQRDGSVIIRIKPEE